MDGTNIWTSGQEIILTNADGSMAQALPVAMSNLRRFDFSPDGTQVVVRAKIDNVDGIFVFSADPDSAAPPVLIIESSYGFGVVVGTPRWSPSGDWITFDGRTKNGNERVYLASPDGQIIMPTGQLGVDPAWSQGTARPVCMDDGAEALVGGSVDLDLLANDSDPDGDAVAFSHAQAPRGGSIDRDTDGRCTYQASGRFIGQDAFSYYVHDGSALLARCQVMVDVRMSPPVLSIDSPAGGAGVAVDPGTVGANGSAQLSVASDQLNVIIVVDLAQVQTTVSLDCNDDGVITAADDVNGDGTNNHLDCYVTAIREIIGQLSGRADVDLALMVIEQNYPVGSRYRERPWTIDYTPNIRVADMSPAAGHQDFAGIDADDDDSGIADVSQVVNGIVHGGGSHCSSARGVQAFTESEAMQCRTANEEKSDEDVLTALAALIDEQPRQERSTVLWFGVERNPIEDGGGAAIWRLLARDTPIHTYSGTTWGCTASIFPYHETSFARRSWLTGGTCQTLFDAATEATARMPGLVAFALDGVTLGRGQDAAAAAVLTGPEDYSGVIGGIVPGPNVLTATALSSDGWEVSAQVTVYGQEGFNTAPVVGDDGLVIAPPIGGSLDVLANDADADGDALGVTVVGGPSEGEVSCSLEGVCDYTPGVGFVDADSFTYVARDGRGGQAIGTVQIGVAPVNGPPVAPVYVMTLQADDTGSVDVMSGVNDPEGTLVSFVSATDGGYGQVSCDGAGVCGYVAADDFACSDLFQYTVIDGDGIEASNTVRVGRDLAPADLALDAQVTGAFVAGGQGEITATLTHQSGEVLLSAEVVLQLPERFNFDGATGAGWECDSAMGGRSRPRAMGKRGR